jgi:hypothetical protein
MRSGENKVSNMQVKDKSLSINQNKMTGSLINQKIDLIDADKIYEHAKKMILSVETQNTKPLTVKDYFGEY